jgi:hypothetical protein
MKRTIAFLPLFGLAVLPAATALADGPPVSAAAFAADCNDDGLVTITHQLRVHGGSGVLIEDCVVVMAPRARLVMRDATLTSASSGLVVGDAQIRSNIQLLRTSIELGGFVQLSPGCCAGDPEPGRSERDATVVVTDSTVRGTTVEVSGSIAADGGTAVVRGSTLEATDGTFDSPLTVLASLTGSGGTATVTDSTLVSANGIRIATGDAGTTTAVGNTFVAAGAVTITTGAGGTCTSSGSTPDVPCT